MDILIPIVKTIHKRYTKDQLGDFLNSLSRNELLFVEKVVSERLKGNSDSSKLLFGTHPSDSLFQNFKRTFRSKVFDFLAKTEPKDVGKNIVEYKRLLNLQMVVFTLTSMNLRSEAFGVLKMAIRTAERFQFHGLLLNFLNLRIRLFPREKKWEINEEIHRIENVLEVFRKESIALGYFNDIQKSNENSNYVSPELISKTSRYCHNISEIGFVESREFIGARYLLNIRLCEMKNDYEGVQQLAQSAILFYNDQGKFKSKRSEYFVFVLMQALMKVGRFKEVLSRVKESQEIFILKKSWISLQEFSILSAFRLGNFSLVKKALEDAHEKATADELIRVWSTRYELYMFYQYLMVRAGQITLDIQENIVARRYNKLVKKFRSDKKGFYIPVLIGELLNFCFTDKLDFILDRVNAIKQYGIDHLNDEANIRSKTFISMLTKVPLAQIQQKKFERDIIKLKKILADNPLVGSKQADELEIIPYEILWGILEKKIEKREIRLI